MTSSSIIMVIGFLMASYAVVANDVIQTLGTFLSSNSKRNWLVLWGFIASILVIVLLAGWWFNNGDMAYGRLGQIPYPEEVKWWFLLPPLILLLVTEIGLPVSTTFMILCVFSSSQVIEKMIVKSVVGYAIAFLSAFALYYLAAQKLEGHMGKKEKSASQNWWRAAQWGSTGFLWGQWLVQDLANIYVYLPRKLELGPVLLTVVVLAGLVAIIFKRKGGKIQQIVTSKTNTAFLRSATIIDLTYGLVLFVFTIANNIPMSTTWVFVGILAGREYALNMRLKHKKINDTHKIIVNDLIRVNAGFAISIALAWGIKWLE